ncbi:hypothetical protein SUGI_0770920 [Cryptomeria japonica]|uniref:organic cation/carnitine transporter 1-like n=1 Tax=Cryptomeria japonica TaxID=3369 RepID=UPI0024148377|nr:organic cation/carnitine transporter 1-like [Cryptomeria japonica]GLJ37893.1 hypothetical protein SUGI_0770920 [Cryptomeria japonica]
MEISDTLNQDLLNVSCFPDGGEKSEEGEQLSVDQILDKYVGAFGRAQLAHVLIVSLGWAFDSMHTLIAVFADAQPSWQCVNSKALDSSKNATVMLPPRWCSPQSDICEMDPSVWEWVNGNGASVVSQWDLICHNKFKAGFPASLFFIGCILGAGILGSLADTCLGRKRTLILSCLIMSVSGFLTALSPNIWVYSAIRLISGFGRAGVGICSLVLSTELVGHKWRGQIGLYGFLFFSAGFASLPAIAYMTKSSWRTTYIFISSLSMAYCCLFLPFIQESPRWLIIRKQEAEALKILRKMATRNNNHLPQNVGISITTNQDISRAKNMKSILEVPWARRRMAVLMAVGAGTGVVYYGMPLNIGNLNFNPYINTSLNALMEVPAIAVGTLLLPITDRRILISVSASTCALCCIVCSFVSNGWMPMIAELTGFLAMCTTFDVVYVFSLELFATDVRSIAVAMLRQAIMAGAAMAPLAVVGGRTHSFLSFLVFGGFAVLSALLTLILPETRNRPLYETMEEQGEEQAGGTRKPFLKTTALA